MRTIESMNSQEKEMMDKFFNFYTPQRIEFFGSILKSKKEAMKEEDYYLAYNKIITEIAKLFKEIGITDPLTASAAFQYMLWNGYFSYNRSLVYSKIDRINNPIIPGADVIRGKSVCLNNASMEANVLQKMNYNAHIIGCKVNSPSQLNLEYRPNIERHIEDINNLHGRIIELLSRITPLSKIGNHAVTLVKTEDQYVVSDPTSLAYYNITGFLSANIVGSKVNTQLKPFLTLPLESLSPEELNKIIIESFAKSDKRVLTPKEVKIIFDNGIFLCKRNASLLDDFHDEIQQDIDTVSKKLTKKRPNK